MIIKLGLFVKFNMRKNAAWTKHF